MTAKYRKALEDGILRDRIEKARQVLEECTLCPRQCRVNRLKEETGICSTGTRAVLASFGPHFGEEPPLTGRNGSGTIFFSFCNLLCCFCQNHDISHKGEGEEVTPDRIASVMIHLEQIGCHNINLVTPTHVVPRILEAVETAAGSGLSIPIVYNSGGYDSVETLKLLDGIVDIYMPDFKFFDSKTAKLLCNAPDYPETAQKAIREMYRQTGDLKVDENGIAVSGLLVRHLVMPEGLSGTDRVMKFLAEEISPLTCVNVMSQYRPCGSARKIDAVSGRPTTEEFRRALETARDLKLNVIS
ncbi:MAG: radical SAM protein [Desulfobacteraceae bacterium]